MTVCYKYEDLEICSMALQKAYLQVIHLFEISIQYVINPIL